MSAPVSASSNAVVRPVVPAAAGTETAEIGSSTVEWSPVDGGTATITTHEPLPLAAGLGVAAGGLGAFLVSNALSKRATTAAGRAGWAAAGLAATLGVFGAVGIAGDHTRTQTQTRSMTRAEFDSAKAHEARNFTEDLPAFAAGVAGATVAGVAASRLLANAPAPVRLGVGAAGIVAGAVGAFTGASAVLDALGVR